MSWHSEVQPLRMQGTPDRRDGDPPFAPDVAAVEACGILSAIIVSRHLLISGAQPCQR